MYDLLSKPDDFIQYLVNQGIPSDKAQILKVDHHGSKKMFTFEAAIKMFIDDGDPERRFQRTNLLDSKFESISIFIDRRLNACYIVLLGGEIKQRGGRAARDGRGGRSNNRRNNLY